MKTKLKYIMKYLPKKRNTIYICFVMSQSRRHFMNLIQCTCDMFAITNNKILKKTT